MTVVKIAAHPHRSVPLAAGRRSGLRAMHAAMAGLAVLCFLGTEPLRGAVFTAAPGMSIPRDRHTATPLPDGRVLVSGGETNISFGFVTSQASAEIYDPAKSAWVPVGRMAATRAGHTATLLFFGTVLIVGGYSDEDPGLPILAEEYDGVRGGWTARGSMNVGRQLHTATLLPDGRVLVVGGLGLLEGKASTLSTAELYDPSGQRWTMTGSLHSPRNGHAAALLPNGKVIVAGGFGSNSYPIYTAEIYNPADGTWTVTAPVPDEPLFGQTLTILPDGRALLAECSQHVPGSAQRPVADIYDPATETWTRTSPLNSFVDAREAVLLPQGKLMLLGGYSGTDRVTNADIYDAAADVWTNTGSMITGRQEHTATLLANGNVLVTGGFQQDRTVLSSAELYYSTNNPVAAVTAMGMVDSSGFFQLSFTNVHGALFQVQANQDPSLKPSSWYTVGCAIEMFPGHYHYCDRGLVPSARRFYRVVSRP